MAIILSDFDETLTINHRIHSKVLRMLEVLFEEKHYVFIITGRPLAWADMMIRTLPITGVVAENGVQGFFYPISRDNLNDNGYQKLYNNRDKLSWRSNKKIKELYKKIKKEIPRIKLSKDQPFRHSDLAIDLSEDISPPITEEELSKIEAILSESHLNYRISSIHLNMWDGTYTKLQGSLDMLKSCLGIEAEEAKQKVYFIGDSPNDEPMWAFFNRSYAVKNAQKFLNQLEFLPKNILNHEEGYGFITFAREILLKTPSS